MNALRVGWIVERCGIGVNILDVGCGGGIAAEAMARAGCAVTGIDAAEEAIAVARAHAADSGLAISYRTGLADDLLAEGRCFAAITALEIIEHVPDQAGFLATLAGLLKPGGLLFVSTLNRTARFAGGRQGRCGIRGAAAAGRHA